MRLLAKVSVQERRSCRLSRELQAPIFDAPFEEHFPLMLNPWMHQGPALHMFANRESGVTHYLPTGVDIADSPTAAAILNSGAALSFGSRASASLASTDPSPAHGLKSCS